VRQTSREADSDDVLADVPEKYRVRAQLICRIDAWRRARRLRQVDLAELLGTSQADVSQMLHGCFNQFSVERLLRFLVALGQDVDIVLTPRDRSRNVPPLRITDGRHGLAASPSGRAVSP
jgi:predicted XRE-type DNA-binding protein